jgi:SAM-dependent methyltransferase
MTLVDRAHAEAIAAIVRKCLPSELVPLFDTAFIRSDHLYGEFVYRLVLGVLRDIGLEHVLSERGSVEEIADRAKLSARQAVVPLDWMLRVLSARGLVEVVTEDGRSRYRLRGPLPALDPAPVREEQLQEQPSWMPAYVLAETAAREYPAFLRGEVSGEDVMFAARRLRLWIEYFSNDHGLYAVNNRVGALAVSAWLPRGSSVLLELGGGLGSGALALLERLEATGQLGAIAEYRFTELVTAFLRRGEQALRARYPGVPPFRFDVFDINRGFEEQGVTASSVSLVYAVNTLHVAHDLDVTLRDVFGALAPGGLLVASECVRPRAGQPIDAEFVFNLTETFRSPRLHPAHRPSGGFLTPEQWRAALEAAGFVEVRVWPEIESLREQVPDFTVAAIGARRPG